MDLTVMPLQDIPLLMQWLETLFPDKCPNPKDSEREIWMKAGERRAVEIMLSKLKATYKEI
jgi:hypothetical protein